MRGAFVKDKASTGQVPIAAGRDINRA